jgi:hypothetical protein
LKSRVIPAIGFRKIPCVPDVQIHT